MIIYFKKSEFKSCTLQLIALIDKESWGRWVTVDLHPNILKIKINKLGTSYLEFTNTNSCWQLESKKISITHRSFVSTVKKKISELVQCVGGSVKAHS